jgi:hypothetical protein
VKYIQIILLVLIQAGAGLCWAAEERCGFTGKEAITRKFLQLKISNSFETPGYFQYCEMRAGEKFLYWEKYKLHSKYDPDGPKKDFKKIALDADSNRAVLEAFDAAMKYNYADDTMGMDGSTWCIKSAFGMTTTNACFWSPDLKPKERRIYGLYQLQGTLEKILGK